MTFVDEEESVAREVIEKGRRRLADRAAVEKTGVVFDPLAVAHLLDHFDVE